MAIEPTYGQLLQQFRQEVLSKTSQFFDDCKDVKIAIHQKLAELAQRDDIPGWVPGDNTQSVEALATELATLGGENRSLRDRLEAMKKPTLPPAETSEFKLPDNLADDDIVSLLRTVIRKTPEEKLFDVMFFEHIDRAVNLPKGTAKRLLPMAAKGLYEIDQLTENSIMLKPPGMGAGIAVRPPREV